MKKHFIFLDKAGIIYYSWLFTLLFIGLIFGYEGTSSINWPAIILVSLFLILLVYTWFNSYYSPDALKFPYRKRIIVKIISEQIWHFKGIRLQKLVLSKLETTYLLTWQRLKKTPKSK